MLIIYINKSKKVYFNKLVKYRLTMWSSNGDGVCPLPAQ